MGENELVYEKQQFTFKIGLFVVNLIP